MREFCTFGCTQREGGLDDVLCLRGFRETHWATLRRRRETFTRKCRTGRTSQAKVLAPCSLLATSSASTSAARNRSRRRHAAGAMIAPRHPLPPPRSHPRRRGLRAGSGSHLRAPSRGRPRRRTRCSYRAHRHGHARRHHAPRGLVKNSNATCLNGRPFRDDLCRALSRSVAFDNDANCFALAETLLGAAVPTGAASSSASSSGRASGAGW